VENPYFTVNMYLCAMFERPNIAIDDFDYLLPDHRIAYTPAEKRSSSKLLIWDKEIRAESTYSHIIDFLPATTSLVFNNSKVIAARLFFEKENSTIEIFCLEPTKQYRPVLLAMQASQEVSWVCLIGGAKKWKEEFLVKKISYENKIIDFIATKKPIEDGKYEVHFSWNEPSLHFSEILHIIGNIPLPPYIQRKASEQDKDRYQTTYAIAEGSVAAPTAGLHFDETVFNSFKEKNIVSEFLTLHVGAGTFMPVKSKTIDAHVMHGEFIEVSINTIESLIRKLDNKENIISVGTTSLRTLESLYWLGIKIHAKNKIGMAIDANNIELEQWEAYDLAPLSLAVMDSLNNLVGWMKENKIENLVAKTQLIILPGYTFKMVNGLITNFHQPKSTLLLIIAAIVGEKWKQVYQFAINQEYRFLSYGDGCLFWINQNDK